MLIPDLTAAWHHDFLAHAQQSPSHPAGVMQEGLQPAHAGQERTAFLPFSIWAILTLYNSPFREIEVCPAKQEDRMFTKSFLDDQKQGQNSLRENGLHVSVLPSSGLLASTKADSI